MEKNKTKKAWKKVFKQTKEEAIKIAIEVALIAVLIGCYEAIVHFFEIILPATFTALGLIKVIGRWL